MLSLFNTDLGLRPLVILSLAALLVGFAKTGFPSVGIFIPALLALSFPAKESVGALVLYLIVGDLFAVAWYHKSADFKELKRLIPWVAIGIGLGAIVLNYIDDSVLKKVLGALVLLLIAGDFLRSRLNIGSGSMGLRVLIGICAGIATAMGNAAGPIMAVYLLMMKLDKVRFMGTAAVFFLTVNVSKGPIFLYLDMIKPTYFGAFLLTFPMVGLGALAGRVFLKKISTSVFQKLVMGFSVAAGFILLFS